MRKLVTAFGFILVAVSLFFILHRSWQQRDALRDWQPDALDVSLVVGGIVAYAVACLFLSTSWKRLLSTFGEQKLDPCIWHSIYARSQIAKYIPGNVLHIVGRHVMGRDMGVGHGPLALSTLYEMVGLLVASGTLALIAASVFGVRKEYLGSVEIGILLSVLVGLLFVGGYYLIPYILSRYKSTAHITGNKLIETFLTVYGYYLGFFLISGLILLSLIYAIVGTIGVLSAAAIVVSFALSWIAGFLTPGAPSGIGIREAIIVFALDGVVPSTDALLAALLFRLVTIMGDILFLVLVLAVSTARKSTHRVR